MFKLTVNNNKLPGLLTLFHMCLINNSVLFLIICWENKSVFLVPSRKSFLSPDAQSVTKLKMN